MAWSKSLWRQNLEAKHNVLTSIFIENLTHTAQKSFLTFKHFVSQNQANLQMTKHQFMKNLENEV